MSELFTQGSVGGAAGNCCLYPATRIAMLCLIEIGWACDGALALKVVSLARNRVISSVSWAKINQSVQNLKHCITMNNNYSATWFELFLEPIQPIQTEKEITFLTHYLPKPLYKTILDICCGQGRHSNLLAAQDYQVTGIDLSQEALEKAEQTSNGKTVYRKMDMRNLKELPASFDAMINLWQSFGYFDAATNRDILQQMRHKLNAKGRLILDIYHRGFFEKHQGVRAFEKSGLNITETKTMFDNRLTVKLDYSNVHEPDSFEWQLYSPDEIRELGQEVGLKCLIICTNFDEQQEVTDNNPRMQIVFEK